MKFFCYVTWFVERRNLEPWANEAYLSNPIFLWNSNLAVYKLQTKKVTSHRKFLPHKVFYQAIQQLWTNCRKLQICSLLLKKSFKKNFFFMQRQDFINWNHFCIASYLSQSNVNNFPFFVVCSIYKIKF